jgi:hypothetical protein
MQALNAVGIIGSAEDLNMLESVAAADPYYDSENGFYPYRNMARLAAQSIRRRLAAQVNPKR